MQIGEKANFRVIILKKKIDFLKQKKTILKNNINNLKYDRKNK